MKYVLMIYLALAAVLVVLSSSFEAKSEQLEYCYAPYGAPVIAEHYVDYVVLRVTWEGEQGGPGWAEWEIWIDEDDEEFTECTVHTPRPLQPLGDPDMDTLGHEVLHCLIGSFHPEDK